MYDSGVARQKKHPIIETDAYKMAVGGEEEEEEEEYEAPGAIIPRDTIALQGTGPMGGFKVILKNCKIHAETVIIKKIDGKRKK